MALSDNDLLAVCRPASGTYKITVGDFKTASGSVQPGVELNDILIWNGTEWARSDVADGGTKFLSANEYDYPDP